MSAKGYGALMLRFVIVLIATATLSIACAPGLYPPDSSTTAAALLNATNVDRTANGLPSLVWSAPLGVNAARYANTLADTGNFVHQDLQPLFNDPSYGAFNILGENLLTTSGSVSGQAMEKAFMASSPHRENILNPRFRYIGIGLTVTPSGRTYVAVEFGG